MVPILLKSRYVYTRRFRSHHFGVTGFDRSFLAQGARGILKMSMDSTSFRNVLVVPVPLFCRAAPKAMRPR